MFGVNGGLLVFTIANPKYLKSPNGLDPSHRFGGRSEKILSTFLGISVCILTRSIPFGVCGLDFIPVMVWVGVIVNGISINIII
jgi:hypothetical protein